MSLIKISLLPLLPWFLHAEVVSQITFCTQTRVNTCLIEHVELVFLCHNASQRNSSSVPPLPAPMTRGQAC